MGANRTNSRLLERVWTFLDTHGDAMRSDTIHKHLQSVYGANGVDSQAQMTQTLIKCGLFRRVGWLNTKTEKMYPTKASARELREMGIPNTHFVCVLEARKIEDICAPYLDPTCSPMRAFKRQPAFVRKACETLRGEQ